MSEVYAALQLKLDNGGARSFHLDLDLTLPGTGITAIYGASGSGKTTLLRCIAGLTRAQGTVRVNGDVWQDGSVFLPTHRRPLGYVFQDANLFPHLDVKRNLAYACKRAQKPTDKQRYEHILEVLGITHLLNQAAHSLSGGEQQRVAIARALLIGPEILLMDEPLASLDAARKQEILPYLEAMHAEFKLPVLYVSHAVEEVARLADHAVILANGQVTAKGCVSDLLAHLDTPLQNVNDAGVIVTATVTNREDEWKLMEVETSGGKLWLTDSGEAVGTSIRVRILARDVSLTTQEHSDTSILNRLPAIVTEMQTLANGATCLVQLTAGSEKILARITRKSAAYLKLDVGSQVWIQVKSAAVAH